MATTLDPRLADLRLLRLAGLRAQHRQRQATGAVPETQLRWPDEPESFFHTLAALRNELPQAVGGERLGEEPSASEDMSHAGLLRRLRLNKYIPQFPTPKQAYALLLPHLEVFFGGSAGPGKSSWLLMSALQYIDTPGYAAILFRRTFTELSKPDALMDRAHHWLRQTDAHWDGQRHTYVFPSGAQLVFSHLENESSIYEHQSAAYQFIGFDETTSFTERMYRFLFSRLRRLTGSVVPLRMRGASNPGGIGHAWVRQRFMVDTDPGRAFVPARQLDNPHLDVAAYEHSLAQLDPVTRQRLKAGDWDITEEGKLFKAHWFPIVRDWPRGGRTLRFWDFAGTEERTIQGIATNDPDWTVGLKLTERGGQYWAVDVRRERLTPKGVGDLVRQTAQLDGPGVEVWLEQEPGSSGKAVVEDYQRRVLAGFSVHALRSTGSKVERSKPASSAAEAGNILLVEGAWNKEFLDELGIFPGGAHDDQVDTLSGGINVFGTPVKTAGTWGR